MNEPVRLFGAIAVRPVILPLIARFEAESGHHVEVRWELNPFLRKEVEAGAACDVVVTNPHYVHELAELGRLVPESQVPFGRIAMGVAARAGSTAKDIGSPDAFRNTLLAARSVAYASEGSSGAYFLGLLDRLGIAEAMQPRLIPVPGDGTMGAVATGEAELGVLPVASILNAAPDVMLLGLFPAELQSYIDFAIGISTAAANRDGARQLSIFLTSPGIDEALAASGLERP